MSTCQFDPIPLNLSSHCIDNIVPIIAHVVNLFPNTGTFPHEFKTAFAKPVLKKRTLHSND